MRKINQAVVNNLPIPLPPYGTQEQIVERVGQLMAICDDLKSKLTQSRADSEKLIEAVVHHLLNGNE